MSYGSPRSDHRREGTVVMGTTADSKAAPTQAPALSEHVKGESVKHPRAGQVIAGSGRQSDEDRRKEREALAPTVLGPGSGTRVVDADGNEVTDLHDLHDDTGETIVTLGQDVYEEFAAPGAPNRKIKRLLFHKGQQVPKSVLQRHQDSMESNQDEVDRLADLGDGTGHPLEGQDARPAAASGPNAAVETSNSRKRSDDQPKRTQDPGEGEGTTTPAADDAGGGGETKEGDTAGEVKEGTRSRVSRRK